MGENLARKVLLSSGAYNYYRKSVINLMKQMGVKMKIAEDVHLSGLSLLALALHALAGERYL